MKSLGLRHRGRRPSILYIVAICVAAMATPLAAAAPLKTNYREIRANDVAAFGGGIEGFGRSLSLDGDQILVGSTNNNAAYLFDYQTGTQLRKMSGPSRSFFGASTLLQNGVAFIGAPRRELHNPWGGFAAGSVYVYNASTGAQLANLQPSDSAASNGFGYSLAGNNDFLLVGAPAYEMGNSTTSGAAYVFDPQTRTQLRKLVPSDPIIGDSFGYSVAVSGNLALIGAMTASHNDGAAYLFDLTTGAQLRKFQSPGGGSGFGTSVAFQGDHAIIGAKWHGQYESPTRYGSTFIFDVNTGERLTYLTATPDEPIPGSPHRDFGYAVAADDERIAVTATMGTYGGSAFVYDAETLASQALLAGTSPAFYTWRGSAIALRGDDVVVGATGFNAVQVYSLVPEPSAGLLGCLALGALGFRSRSKAL